MNIFGIIETRGIGIMKKISVIAIALSAVVVMSGCSSVQQSAPEPTPDDIINGTNTQVIQMPEGFRNVAFTCHGTTGVYVTSRGWIKGSTDANLTPLPSDISVVPDHEMCRINS